MLKFIEYCLVTFLLFSINNPSKATGRRKGTLRPYNNDGENWTGRWFPFKPNDVDMSKSTQATTNTCDMKSGITMDFDVANKTHSYNYLCLNNRTLYMPNIQREAVLTEHFIPPAYVAPIKCHNESTINYDETIPTYGPFRLFAPKYGTYKYLPPQRWLRSLADGAIVMLYHPCSFPGQIASLRNTLKACLYRHIITPNQNLAPERPLALLAWGKLLQMSVVDDRIVVEFIKENAKHVSNAKSDSVAATPLYDVGLVEEARLVTDMEDSEICGYKNM